MKKAGQLKIEIYGESTNENEFLRTIKRGKR